MTTETSKRKAPVAALAIFGVLAIIGIVCWVLQLNRGLILTNLSVKNMWGLYIVGFMIFTGIAAGCLFFAALPYLVKSLDGYKPYTKIAAFVAAIASVVAASLFIIVDIGNPERAWQFVTSPNFSSPMFWDFLMLVIYMVLSIIFTRNLMVGKKEPKGLAVVCAVLGMLVMITSFVFCFQVARPMWNNPVQPLSFLCAAFAAALALLMIIGTVLNKRGYITMPVELLAKMGKAVAAFLLVELVVVISEVLVGLYPGGGGEYAAAHWQVAGQGALLFWLEIVAIVAAIILLAGRGASVGKVLIGAIVALIAIYLIKTTLLQAELLNPVLSLPGAGLIEAAKLYFPSLVEIGVSVGIVALGGFLVTLGLYKLPLNK